MKSNKAFRFTLGKRIGLSFGLLIFLVIIILTITYQILNDSIEQNERITNINSPSLTSLEELKLFSYRAKMLVTAWVSNQSNLDHPDKVKFLKLIKIEYPSLKKRILSLSKHWEKEEQKKIQEIFNQIARLIENHIEVTTYLDSFESYDDPEKKFYAEFMTEQDGPISVLNDKTTIQLNALISDKKSFSRHHISKMLDSFAYLKTLFRYLGAALILGGLVITITTTRSIVGPVRNLRNTLLDLSIGVFPDKMVKETNDEVGEMSSALNKVVLGLKHTKDFAEQIGAGHFDTEFTPLSEKDSLGYALLSMRTDLERNERDLEAKVEQRTVEVVKQKEEIEIQNKKIRFLYEELTGSIRYAKKLQEAIFPSNIRVDGLDTFILFKPKDIVSGDFYWTSRKENDIYIAAVDCTGHGVPGAFMSILGNSGLNEALNSYSETSEILDSLNKSISITLNPNESDVTDMKDGMDMALCRYNVDTKKLQYSGANNPLYLIRDKQVIQYKSDKMAIGGYATNKEFKYNTVEIDLKPQDAVYIFSDGYADQFGGPKNKKFKYKQFRELLTSIFDKPMVDQRNILDEKITDWMNESNQEQIDDILVIGIKAEEGRES